MKYESPKYEISLLEASDIIMSGESYTIEKSEDTSGNVIGDVIMTALDLFN